MFKEFSKLCNQEGISTQHKEKCSFNFIEILFMDKAELQQKVFELEAGRKDKQGKRFVHIKCSDLGQRSILQIIDISDSILYDQQKAQVEFQDITTACVSHEFRNPLNSITAQNINKGYLYAELQELLEDNTISEINLRERCLSILARLREGLKIQEVSTEMMTYLVQDILDMAQINSNKFRKNINQFNVMDSIKKAIDMH